jgi:thioesterase domain-containing protein
MAGLGGHTRLEVNAGWVGEAWSQVGAPADLRKADLEVVSAVARKVSASCGVSLPSILFATSAATPAGATGLLDSLTPTSPLRGARCERLLPLRPGDRAAVVLVGPSESSLLLLRDVAIAFDDVLPADVGVYGVGCYDPYRPGWRRPLSRYARRLTTVIDALPAQQPALLIGYSAAGMFAHDAAAGLHDRRSAVVLLDTFMRRGFRAVPRTPRARLQYALTGLLTQLPDALGRRVVLPRERRRAVAREAAGLPATGEAAMLEWMRSRTLTWFHHPAPATFPELLLTTTASEKMLGDPDLGWRAIRRDAEFTVEHTAGNHRSLLHQPHVVDVARRITEFAPSFLDA